MNEFFVRNRLSAYLDGDLSAAEAREVESALARDAALRAEYESLRAAVELLREHGPMRSPEGFLARLDERLAAEPAPGGWRTWVRSVRPGFVAVAAIAAAALLYIAQPQQEVPPGALPEEKQVAKAAGGEAPAGKAGPEEAGAGEREPDLPPVNNILGDEGFAAAREAAKQQRASLPDGGKAPSKQAPSYKETYEKEAYAPPWEADPEMTVIRGDEIVQTGQNTGLPVQTGETAKTAPTKQLYSPPPFRYRVRSTEQQNLELLAGVVRSLGGKLVDGAGRPVAIHMLDQGEVKQVRVLLPAGKVEQLTSALAGLGDVETMATDPGLLYDAGAEVPVQVELERE